jgi:hypothetical protein
MTSLVSPFAANTALVLHKGPADNRAGVKYLVQTLHNEKYVIMPVNTHLRKFNYLELKTPNLFLSSFDFTMHILGSMIEVHCHVSLDKNNKNK